MTDDYPRTIRQVRAINRDAGGHFFDKDAMRFFRSRVHDEVHGGRYFVTSEQFVESDGTEHDRRYSVREIDDAGQIWTVGNFQQYATARDAHAAARSLAAGIDPSPVDARHCDNCDYVLPDEYAANETTCGACLGRDVELCVDCVWGDAYGYDPEVHVDGWNGFLPEWTGYVFESIRTDRDEPVYGFGKSPCHGCGSGLAGDRYEYHAVPVTTDARLGRSVDA